MQQLLFFLNTKQILVIPQKYQSPGGAYTISQYLHCPFGANAKGGNRKGEVEHHDHLTDVEVAREIGWLSLNIMPLP